MLTVKFMKFNVPEGTGSTDGSDLPSFTDGVMVRECKSIHLSFEDCVTKVQLNDAPGDTFETTVGPSCPYQRAYVMNGGGQTVETIT